MAEEPNGSIASTTRSSIWLKEIAAHGLSQWISLKTSRASTWRQPDVYKRLPRDEFRTLQIELHGQPGSHSNTFSCQLETHKLDAFSNEEGYAAVSYTWKSHAQHWNYGQDQATVTVQGQSFSAAARVAPMLSTLHKNGFKRVWIDALCINQLDIAERSKQVALMRQIYSNASQVVVFLGSGSSNTDALFDFLNQRSIQGGRISDMELLGLSELVSNPYWQRAWIIQEVAVARKITLVCGSKRTSWDALVQVLARWDVAQWALPSSSGSDFPGREIRMIDDFRRERPGPLVETLQKTRSSKATNPLDVIYAKLGLANDASALVSRITYNIDASTLFKSIVKRYIATKHDLYIMCLVREGQEMESNLPSWTPDWTKSTIRYPLLRFFFSGWMNINHQAHAKMNVSFSSDLNEIRVRGVLLDTLGKYYASRTDSKVPVSHAKDVFPSICRAALAAHFVLPNQNDWKTMPPEFIDLFAKKAVRLEFAGPNQSPSNKSTLHTKLYAMANTDDKLTSSGVPQWSLEELPDRPNTDDFQQWYAVNREVVIAGHTVAEWAKAYQAARETTDEHAMGSHNLSTGGIERSLTAIAWNRRLTGTTSGRPALVPEAAVEGDLICALYGCPVPVVLRRCKRQYTFIGECFVDEFMDEEQAFGSWFKQPHETIFNLR